MVGADADHDDVAGDARQVVEPDEDLDHLGGARRRHADSGADLVGGARACETSVVVTQERQVGQ